VGEAKQVVLVCATAGGEDEQARRVSIRRTLAEDESAHVVRAIVASLSAQSPPAGVRVRKDGYRGTTYHVARERQA
jgi:hypothetical protein